MRLGDRRYSDQVKKLVIERISDGTYKPGDRLVELQLSRELSISLAPVREALGNLAALKIVDRQPYRVARIRKLSPKDLADSVDVLAVLESLAAEKVENRLESNLGLLEKEAHAFIDAAKKDQKAEYARAYREFHRLIVEASNNRILMEMWESMTLEITILTGEIFEGPNRKVVASNHLNLVKALKKTDKKLASKLLKNLHHEYRD